MGTVAVALFTMTLTLTVTPSNGGLLSPPQITINAGAGEQSEPHVDGDTAAYSNSLIIGGLLTEEIRYYDFPSNTDRAISNILPDGGIANDLLSDIDQGNIVFTRLAGGQSRIMLFDAAAQTTTELAPAPNTTRIGVAIGGQTVVFVDYSLTTDGNGELVVVDLATSVVTRLTTNSVSDANPAVSPDGNVVTWERCEGSNCDIYRATRAGGVWSIDPMSSSVLTESNPDTNGTQIVYQRDDLAGPTGTNLVLVPVTGGAETVLEIPGEQYNPSIRGQLVAFESRGSAPLANSDLFLVDLATNRMFQITNTPDVTESLNDITVLPGGEVRVVWQAVALNDATRKNIFAATFSLPGVGPPNPTCANRSATLEATRFYSPTRSVDGHLDFTPAMGFAIPAALPVVAGNAGNKKAYLTIELSDRTLKCEYRSGSTQSHPSSPSQLALATSYRFNGCHQIGCDDDGAVYAANTVVTAASVRLHIQNGDTHQPMTRIRLTLGEVCSTSTVTSPLQASNSIDGPEAAGCSSTGASLTPFLIAFAFLALMLRRPTAIRLVTRQEQRRLPR